ncbi:MAG TPA: asparagine synthase (glutamine-hydrolyzing) [Thermoleophilaceae bacterium]|nr:asparagine synthase (glutamine-hydrolyzing) [Thermoleophilaceae bacterium]
MCGICGIFAPEGPDADSLGHMAAALVHRGPDDHGAVVDGPAALAARRLSIIDLEGGHQPIANEDRTVHVVQNGEIYNHAALRRELERSGHRFRTRCDTEAIVHLYEEEGLDFAERLRGMFAVAIWDSRRRRLVLARDRFGIKPLYFSERTGSLAFASELKALRRWPGFSAEVDLDALESFLTFNSIPGPLTIFRGTHKLLPGHLLVADERGTELMTYAVPRPRPAGELRDEPLELLEEELRARLRDSVRAHLVSDVPVGVLLSGGVDSAALTALAAEESESRVSTFSIGFEEQSFDELEHARLVARRYDTDHHELTLRPDAAALLPRLADVFDEPLADSSALPTFLVSELASRHVKVALSGEGGDELFGGYYTYVADLLAPRLSPLARLARPVVERLPSSDRRVSFDYKAKRFVGGAGLAPLERHHAWKEIFGEEARAELMRRRAANPDPLAVWRERFAESGGAETLARLQDVDLGIYLVDDLLVKTDRASMANSLETRVPFLDTEVSELALGLPTSAKVRGLRKKVLLRRAVAPLVPREIHTGKKRGFSIPAAAWLRGELEPFAREVLSPANVGRQGFLDPAAVTRVLDRHISRRADLSRQLWGLISFTLWFERWGRAEKGPPVRR